MATKLKNPALTKFMLVAGKLTDGWVPLHSAGRGFYLHTFTPWFESRLRKAANSPSLQLVPRHSIQRPEDFNLFFSDIDYTIVLENDLPESQLGLLRKKYDKLALRFPFVGELEIYTAREWELRRRLAAEHGDWLDLIWYIRKHRWQAREMERASSEYHRFKVRRAVRKGREKLRTPETEGLELSLQELTLLADQEFPAIKYGSLRISGESTFLGWSLANVPAEFAASLPDGEWISPLHADKIHALRNEHDVSSRLCALSVFELLMGRTRKRVFQVESDPDWISRLRRILEKHDKDLHAISSFL